jgi:hypothetical protein
MFIAYSSYHVFGSGAASASLAIDGIRVTYAYAKSQNWAIKSEDNGFVGYNEVDIPISTLIEAKEVHYECGAIPGGTTKIKAKGRHFVKRYLGCRPVVRDRLLLMRSGRSSRAVQARYEKWRDGLFAWAKAHGKIRYDKYCNHEWRVTFRLPDGCLGGRWVKHATTKEIGYPVPCPTAVPW